MNVALVNPIAATPAYTTRDFILRPTLPGLTADTGQLRETNLVDWARSCRGGDIG